jgi:hypothetical protein
MWNKLLPPFSASALPVILLRGAFDALVEFFTETVNLEPLFVYFFLALPHTIHDIKSTSRVSSCCVHNSLMPCGTRMWSTCR